jgi:hypothetical protein
MLPSVLNESIKALNGVKTARNKKDVSKNYQHLF